MNTTSKFKYSLIYALLSLCIHLTSSKPIQGCQSQFPCLDIVHNSILETDTEGNQQYRMCLFWKTSDLCPKDHPRYVICDIVSCDDIAHFSIKDGDQCEGIAEFDAIGSYTPENGQQITCDGDQDLGSCHWDIPALPCAMNQPATSEEDDRTSNDGEGGFGAKSMSFIVSYMLYCTLYVLLVIGIALLLFISIIVIFSLWYAKRLNRITKNNEYLDVDTDEEGAVESASEEASEFTIL
eukprot:648853_1